MRELLVFCISISIESNIVCLDSKCICSPLLLTPSSEKLEQKGKTESLRKVCRVLNNHN